MGYSIACGDVMPGCAERLEAGSEDELMRRVAEHAGADHGLTEIPPDVANAVRAAIVRHPEPAEP